MSSWLILLSCSMLRIEGDWYSVVKYGVICLLIHHETRILLQSKPGRVFMAGSYLHKKDKQHK